MNNCSNRYGTCDFGLLRLLVFSHITLEICNNDWSLESATTFSMAAFWQLKHGLLFMAYGPPVRQEIFHPLRFCTTMVLSIRLERVELLRRWRF